MRLVDALSFHASEHVGSYLELYATMYGLKAGQEFFALLWGIGLFKLIFAVVAARTFYEGYKIGGSDGAWFAVRMLGLRFVGFFFLLLLFVWPNGKLNVDTLAYQPPTTFEQAGTGTIATVSATDALATQQHGNRGFALNGSSGSGGGLYNIDVPIMLRLSMQLGHGINRATTQALPDRLSLRLLDQGLANLKIDDPTLKSNVVAFNTQCYLPAINKYQTFWRDKEKPQPLKDLERTFSIDDLSWMGSRILNDTPGLYRQCNDVSACGSSLQATSSIKGFPYVPLRDGEPLEGFPAPEWGYPYCDQWWHSLRSSLWMDQRPYMGNWNAILLENGLNPITSAFNPGGVYSAEDTMARLMLSRTHIDSLFNDDLSHYTGKIKSDGIVASSVRWAGESATEFMAWTGNLINQPFASAENLTLNNLAQITQSIVLMALYMLAPFVAVLSAMRFQVLFTYCVLVLSVVCWQLWWTVTMWVDTNLLMSMYPSTGEAFTFIEDLGSKRMLLDRVTNGMAILAPAVWSFLLTFAGWKAADGIGAALNRKSEGISRGVQSGVNTATRLAAARI